MNLKAARTKRDASRQQLAAGIDPGEARKAEKQAQAGAESFEKESAAEKEAKLFARSWINDIKKISQAAPRTKARSAR